MTNVKLKFRPSASRGNKGSISFLVTHEKLTFSIVSKYRIYQEEWDEKYCRIRLPCPSSSRFNMVSDIRRHVLKEARKLKSIIDTLDSSGISFGAKDVIRQLAYAAERSGSVFNFIYAQVLHKRLTGKLRSSETYRSTLHSFMDFRQYADLSFDQIDSCLMELYEANLKRRGLSRNTTSFYMRILRTNYRLAVEMDYVSDCRPFRHVYCGIDKTVKRSISFEDIRRIKELDLSGRPCLDYARDMFIFSFCTRGMSFIDMAYLKKKDLCGGHFTYRRKKTGQLLTVEWTKQMQDILDKYGCTPTDYLLPIILREDGTERTQYQNQMSKVNRRLKEVARLVGLSVPLSLYYSRHSWASIARCKDVPLAVISEGLGHDSEITTQIYLDSIKSYEVDKANRKILRGL